MLWKLFKTLIGILFLPVCFATSRAFYNVLISIEQIDKAGWYFLSGIALYVVLYFCSFRMNYLYVLGHETTHAILALVFGGKVTSFKVSSKGGSVASTKSNVVISLGPYFFPIYSIFISIAFFVCGIFWKQVYAYTSWFIALLGFSIAFHFLMTIDCLRTEQPDLVQNGQFFSLVLIYLINMIIFAMALSLLFHKKATLVFFTDSFTYSKEVFVFLYSKIAALF